MLMAHKVPDRYRVPSNQPPAGYVVLGMTRIIRRMTAVAVATCVGALAWPSAASAADVTPPTVPQDLRVTGTTAGSVSLAWGASTDWSGGVKYRVYLGGSYRATTAETAYTQTGLASGTSYTFVVRAEDRYGNRSAASNSVTASTGGGTGAPAAPTNLRVTGTTYDSVSLAWDAAAGSVWYYQILRNGQWVNSSYGTTGTVRYLTAGTSYTIEVRARDTNGTLSASATVTAATQSDGGPPTIPANLRVVKDAAGTPVGLTWDASTDDRGVGDYWLFGNGDVVYGGGVGVDFFSLTDVDCTVFHGETYSFTVRARDLSGNLSEAATPVSVTVP